MQDSPEHFLTYPLITGRKEDGKAEMATLGEFACSWSLKEMRPSRFCVYVRGRCLFCVFTLKNMMNFPRVLFPSLLWENKEGASKQNSGVFLGNLYAGQEATVRTGHGSTELVPNRERSTLRLYIVTQLI